MFIGTVAMVYLRNDSGVMTFCNYNPYNHMGNSLFIQRRRGAGFTVIEIVLAVIVIALLIGIGITAFQGGK